MELAGFQSKIQNIASVKQRFYVDLGIVTIILNVQNRASCRKVFVGFTKKRNISTSSNKGLIYAGIDNAELYKKLRTDIDQTTPKMAASSMTCCSDRWFRGSISNMSTWLTPDDRQPQILMPQRNRNSTIRSGPRYRRQTIRQSSSARQKKAEN